MKSNMKLLSLLLVLLCANAQAFAFCGFYVAKADAKLFNKSSQVIIVRDGNHTVITMANDFQGSVKDFAMVVPVPEVLKESDIRVAQQHIFDKFDAYTSPRMVEYYDANPCQPVYETTIASGSRRSKSMALDDFAEVVEEEKDLGVTIEATYTVGEYDILILSAKESGGLKTWLTDNGYKIPANADEVLEPYIQDQMKFFVVKVNLEKQSQSGFTALRPLQIQFNSDRFMLPIRLGMANAESTQDLIIYAFTRNGRVETANYRTTKLPTDREIPMFVKDKGLFGDFYKSTFEKAWKNEGRNTVMLEYAWNVSGSNPIKCDPCNTPAVTFAELREAGVWWIQPGNMGNYQGQLFVTRLHVRYGREKFPQDLVFMNTPNSENFQGRYIVRHEATGPMDCSAGKKYKKELAMRKKRELQELASLTGWGMSKYQWYLGEATEEPPKRLPVKEEELLAPPTTPTPPQEVIGAVDQVETDTAVAEAVVEDQTGLAWQPDPEVEAFNQRASEAAQKAAAPVSPNWLLLAVAGGMFLLGMWVRRKRKVHS